MTTQRVVYLTGSHDFHYQVTKTDTSTARTTAATGLTVAGLFASAEPTIGSSELDVDELGSSTTSMAEIGSDGDYLGTLSHANKIGALGESVGETVYEVITVAGIVELVTPVTVRLAKSA